MTGPEFTAWVKRQQAFTETREDVAERLKVSRSTFFRMMKNGTSEHSDLAIKAVDAGLDIKGDE